jgi:hypothetical protein
VRHLKTRFFRMTTGGDELHITAERNGSWDFSYGERKPVGRNAEFAALFKGVPHVVDGKTYWQLRCYDMQCELRTSGLDWGNGDSLCAHPDGRSLIEGTCRANGKFAFGQDRDGDGLWEVAEVKGGFTFRNKASGLYLGGPSARHSRTPVTWECVTRAVRPK